LNYRHGFHAGNFADVLKHTVLTRVLLHLREKESPFRVIDTHAGAGRYDLSGEEAARTGEWRDGIGRLLSNPPAGEAGLLLEPYLDAVRAANSDGSLTIYPGSPALALAFTRPQDRLISCELHPAERTALSAVVADDRRAKVFEIDGWTALKAHLPPAERRGLVLIDPPFEQEGEFQRFESGLKEAHRRWATGIYLFWYPIKDSREGEAFARRLMKTGIGKILRFELTVAPVRADEGLSACGMIAINPPWPLESQLQILLPALTRTLSRGTPGEYRLDWLAR
jgi:23S rRNA (adenine2030-N6)-methyltransferase